MSVAATVRDLDVSVAPRPGVPAVTPAAVDRLLRSPALARLESFLLALRSDRPTGDAALAALADPAVLPRVRRVRVAGRFPSGPDPLADAVRRRFGPRVSLT